MGILNTDDMQIVFSDTPGVVKPNYKLQESMLNFSESALVDADILLYVTDVVEKTDKNADFIEKVRNVKVPVLLLINKIDLTNQKTWSSWWKRGTNSFLKLKLFRFPLLLNSMWIR